MQKLVTSKPIQKNEGNYEPPSLNDGEYVVKTLQSNTGKSKAIVLTSPFEMYTDKEFRKEVALREFVSFDSIELVDYKK